MSEVPYYVDVRKWPDAAHWHYQVFELGEDEHGHWFCLPRLAVVQRRPEPPRSHIGTTAKLIPRRGSWVASFNAPDHRCEVYVDVAAGAAQIHERSISFIDVDLDVLRERDGLTHIVDVDEFEEHRISLAYPETLVAAARATADELHAAISGRQEPFGRDGMAWLERALSRPWPIDATWLDGSS